MTYFNFSLAKEMGLVPDNHDHVLNADLEQKLIETFNLRIINEFDQERPRLPESWKLKPKPYMATRYLQLQHSSKKGHTSGDGRSIWNGVVRKKGKVWDVSSRGTGVTRFAPGSVRAQKNLPTGGEQFGYGCGLAELDELYASAVQSEIFHAQGIGTERVLCIIDQGNGCGIGVRAGENLLRPAHLFLYLKQNRYAELKAATDYFIERQIQNNKYVFRPNDPRKYQYLANSLSQDFSRFVGRIEAENIFLWMEWDGDNILMDPGIIDYGSIRQFGLHHATYRYDDVERFSTNLIEQKYKAYQVMKTMLQMTDFLETGERKSLSHFSRHPIMKKFVENFGASRREQYLHQTGFSATDIRILQEHPRLLQQWEKRLIALQRKRVSGSPRKVADGVLSPALFDVRNLLRALPEHFLKTSSWESPDFAWCLEKMKTSYSRKKNFSGNLSLRILIRDLISYHKRLLKILNSRIPRNLQTNRTKPVLTGNALIHAIAQINSSHRKAPKAGRIQNLIELLTLHFKPEISETSGRFRPIEVKDPQSWQEILNLIELHRHSI